MIANHLTLFIGQSNKLLIINYFTPFIGQGSKPINLTFKIIKITIEKLNKVLEKLPDEHRDIIREAFTILIEEVINAVLKENEKIWQAIREGFERQEKENERIWQAIKEGFERQEKENERIWQAIKEGFERQEKENEKIWQAIREGFERQEKENERIWQAIEQNTKAIEELRKAMKEGFDRMNRKIEGLGARWGLMAEETFRAGIKSIIEDLGYAVENVIFFDNEGYVFLRPSQIEIDIIIKDSRKIAIEIKSSISEGDVSAFERKVKLYENKFNVKVDKKIILTPFASDKAVDIAKSFDIEIVQELKE